MLEEILEELSLSNTVATENLVEGFKKLRTGRANPAQLQDIKIDYYGTPTPLIQLANVGVPEPRMMIVQPYDASIIGDIEKAILKANIGLTPNSDGKILRINVPPLTEERRKEIVKQISKRSEEAKIAVRNNRREANEQLKLYQKDGDISEDDEKKGLEEVQKSTDKFSAEVDAMSKRKEAEIMND